MDIHKDALKFAQLSKEYRELKANGQSIEKVEKNIKSLLSFTAERLAMTFKIPLQKRKSSISKGAGIPLMGLSINDYIAKGEDFKRKHMTTLDIRKNKTIQGVNIILDYSGSMFFNHPREDTIKGVQRIHAQNFIALCIGVYLQKISKGSIFCVYTAFCETPISIKMTNILAGDLDLLILHNSWGSQGGEATKDKNLKLMPDLLKAEVNNIKSKAHQWFISEDILTAVDQSKKVFNRSMTDVISIIMTDGGCHRMGETVQDRAEYLRKSFNNIAEDSQIFVSLIKTQKKDFIEVCKHAKIKYSEVNTPEQYNNSFLYLGNIIKEVTRR